MNDEPPLRGIDIAGKLSEINEKSYQRMFPFEKAQYHQSIPISDGCFITVQLIERTTMRADP